MGQLTNTLAIFHQAANEGRAITMLRQDYRQRGIFLSAHRIELIIKLKILKQYYNS